MVIFKTTDDIIEFFKNTGYTEIGDTDKIPTSFHK